MIGHYINLLFKWASICRWNNFPRIENVTETDNHAFVLHTIVILYYMLTEKEKKKINLHFIFKKVLLSSFITFVLSDINSDLKKRLIQKNNIMYTKLELKVYNILLAMDVPQQIKDDLNNLLQTDRSMFWNQYEFENDLIKYSKLWVAQSEAKINAIVYKDIYSDTIKTLQADMEQEKYTMFNKYMTRNIEKYLHNIRRLQSSFRWNKFRKIYPISVMSHLYIVFALCYIIWRLENLDDDALVDIMKKWLYHDIPESITWDIVTPTKRAVEGFDKVLEEIEETMIQENLLLYLDKFKFSQDIKKYMLYASHGERWKLMKLADNFSALFEAKLESKHSEEFDNIYKNSKKIINKENCISAQYIMKFWVDYFDDNLDNLLR